MKKSIVKFFKRISKHALLMSFLAISLGCLGTIIYSTGSLAAEPRQLSMERPVIQDGTIHTAWGTPLRGLNVTGFVNAEQLGLITQYGFNAAHYYIDEGPYWPGTVLGESSERLDLLVAEGEKNGFYVVITIGGFMGTEEEVEFLLDFWEYYAPRYKDNKNVIFEIANEMWFPMPFGPDDIDMAADSYQIIRKHAPETMVLFYSFSHMLDWDDCIGAIRQTEQNLGGISWTNEAVAFHGYEAAEGQQGPEIMARVIDGLKAEGYPIINTEGPNREGMSEYVNADLIRVFEEKNISWLCFLDISNMTTPVFWKGSIELANVKWTPDYGTWPTSKTLYPYEIRRAVDDAANVTEASEKIDEGRRVYEVNDGGELCYERVDFGVREPLSVTIVARGGATITILEQNNDGTGNRELAQCVITSDGTDNYQKVTAYLTAPVEGLTNIIFHVDTEGEAVTISNWYFNLPPIDSAKSFTIPYNKTVAAAGYDFRSNGITRIASDDNEATTPLAKDIKIGGITAGSYVEFDSVRYVKRDVTFRVRAKVKEGGKLIVAAGDFMEYYENHYELGTVDIVGTRDSWQEFSCRLDFESWEYFFFFRTDPRPWELRLKFLTADGQEVSDDDKELFEISEFVFDTSGSPQTITINQSMLTEQGSLQKAIENELALVGVGEEGYIRIRDLIISGTLEEEDFRFIREKLSGLWTLDLGNITNTILPERALANEGYITGVLAGLYKLILPPGLERIEDYAISECLNLTTISTAGVDSRENVLTLPSKLTHIGEGAFMGCAFITADLSTANINSVGNWPFAYCEQLEYLKLMSLQEMYVVSLVPPSERLSAIEFTTTYAPDKRGDTIGKCPDGAVIYYPTEGIGYTSDWLMEDNRESSFGLLAIDVAPKVVSIEPFRAEPDAIPISGQFMVTFNQPMKTDTVGKLIMNNRGGVFTPLRWTNYNYTCIIPYSGIDDATDYICTIQGFENAVGTPLTTSGEFNFTSKGKDIEEPKRNEWVQDETGWKYQLEEGIFLTNEWKKDGAYWYYLGADGYMQTGWIQDGEQWYYLAPNGVMQIGWLNNGKWYYLGTDGSLQTGLLQDGEDWYFLDKISGAIVTGWVEDGEDWYFMDYDTGIMATNTWIGGYWVDNDGKWEPDKQR